MAFERNILSLGSLNLDTVFNVDHIVRPGETLSSNAIEHFVGGKGLNQSIAMSKSGSIVYHGGAVGNADGTELIEALEKAGVDTRYVLEKDGLSGNAYIQVDKNGQNSIILFDGANKSLSTQEIDTMLEPFNEQDFIVLQNEINNISYIIDKAKEKKMIIFFNPSPIDDAVFEYPLNKVDWYIVNELEASQLSRQNQYNEETLDKLIKLYPDSNFVITLGEKGSIGYQDGLIERQNVFKVDAVDTTGAGDTFTGYFISSIRKGRGLKESLEIASMASAIAVTRKGASSSIPSLKEVNQKLEDGL